MWTRGLREGGNNNPSWSGRPVNPCVSPGDTSEAESDAPSVARAPVNSSGPAGSLGLGREKKTGRKMRNDAGVFFAGLFLTWIYGFNWQALEENAESPHPASSITRRLLSAVWWAGLVDGVSVRFLPFPSQLQQCGAAFLLASSLGQGAFNFSSLALDGRNCLLPCGSDAKKTIYCLEKAQKDILVILLE